MLTPWDFAVAAATGALTLVDPARIPPRWQRSYRVSVTALTGVTALAVNDADRPLSPAARAALATGLSGAVYGSAGLWERLDAGTVAWLRDRGVKRPRVVLAVAATGLTLLSAALEKRGDSAGQEPDVEPDEEANRVGSAGGAVSSA